MEPITRERMRILKSENDLAKRYRDIKTFVKHYYDMVKYIATNTNVTKHFIDIRSARNGIPTITSGVSLSDLIEDIMAELRTLFPGCRVAYHETKHMASNQVIESGILVDWS